MSSFCEIISGMHGDGAQYFAHVSENWLQGRTTFGGMSGGLCVAAAMLLNPDLPPLRSAQFTFVGPAFGDVVVTPRVVRQGKSSVFMHVELSSEGKLATQAMLCFGAARESKLHIRARPIPVCTAPSESPAFFDADDAPQFARNFDSGRAGGARLLGGVASDPEYLVWLRHRDRKAARHLPGLIALADVLPPAAFAMGEKRIPISTISWGIDVVDAQAALNADDGTWFLSQTVGQDLRDGYASQDMAMWNERGELVLMGRQVVAIFG